MNLDPISVALRPLAKLLLPLLREELAAEQKPMPQAEADRWVDQTSSPLGRRGHCRACKMGEIEAHKVGKRWLARRSAVDAYVQKYGIVSKAVVVQEAAPVDPDEPTEAEVMAMVRSFGCEPIRKHEKKPVRRRGRSG